MRRREQTEQTEQTEQKPQGAIVVDTCALVPRLCFQWLPLHGPSASILRDQENQGEWSRSAKGEEEEEEQELEHKSLTEHLPMSSPRWQEHHILYRLHTTSLTQEY